MKYFIVALPLLLVSVGLLVLVGLAMQGRIQAPVNMLVGGGAILVAVAAAAMYYLFNKLVAPLRQAREALDKYLAIREIPNLPVEYSDEAGQLLTNIQATITQLDTLLSEKSDMIDLLSHDMRSPLGRILSLSQMVKTDNEGDKSLYADYITNECRGLLRMLENILLMLKEDNRVFTVTNVNLKLVILETVSFFDFAVAEKSIDMKLALDESIFINVQPDLFTQAIRNIIGNAIKFSPDGKSISITAKQQDEQIIIAIQDEGLGFKPKDIERIFDRFTAAGKKGTHGETSTGLGLYLSKKIVEKHGGKLIAESEGINKGASFTIILYRLVTKKSKGKAIAAGIPAPEKGKAALKGRAEKGVSKVI